jgi:putative transposase
VDSLPHRKLVKHCDEPGYAHELTFSCYRRQPLLTDDRRCVLLSRAIDRAIEKHGFELIAFVYMPEHVHLIVFPIDPTAQVSRLLFAIKRPFSFRVRQQLHDTSDPLLDSLTIRDRPGHRSFRFWQEGPGYDRNIRKVDTLRAAVDYVHHNPVRRGLCDSPDKWKFSSWRFYFVGDQPQDPDLPTVHGFDL